MHKVKKKKLHKRTSHKRKKKTSSKKSSLHKKKTKKVKKSKHKKRSYGYISFKTLVRRLRRRKQSILDVGSKDEKITLPEMIRKSGYIPLKQLVAKLKKKK